MLATCVLPMCAGRAGRMCLTLFPRTAVPEGERGISVRYMTNLFVQNPAFPLSPCGGGSASVAGRMRV
jgi:hypothetical protein